MEKVSRRSNFEWVARISGCVIGRKSSIVGIMFTITNQFVFWLGSWLCTPSSPFLPFSPKRMRPSATVANAAKLSKISF
ncbi:MFS transporter [Escherichia coli]|uniref:MFS transporter n=1 Tax=Escherichia coli TaxID=562 RepID=UPI00388EE0CA